MEEGFEVETRVEPQEEVPRHWLIPAIAVTTGLLAVAAAYAGLQGTQTAHRSLAALTQAAIFQDRASDQWNFYQAEGLKRHMFEVQRDVLGRAPGAAAAALAARYAAEARRYGSQQATIRRDAETLERRRDAAEALSGRFDVRYERLGGSVALFQIGIVVCSVAAIIRRPGLWVLALAAGAAGLALLAQALLTPVAAGGGG